MKQMEMDLAEGTDLFDKIADHEQVVFCNDPATGLKAIIAIHNTTLGPGLGGTRMYPYDSIDEALEDVLRLAEGMTYKCAAADLDFGGAKAVIIGDPATDKSPALFRAFGQYVDSLNGRFYTGTDMGTTMEDFVQALKETNFINGLPEAYGGGGDSSIPTAKGVINGLKATNQFLFGSDELAGKTYAVQGLGKVGAKVVDHLLQEDVTLYVTDINETALNLVKEKAKTSRATMTIVESDEIYQVDADVFIPCAMGGVISDKTIAQLKVKAVCGSANNQLTSHDDGKSLHEKGILYAPDYIVNAGGLISVADELYGSNEERVMLKTRAIYDSLLSIYQQANAEQISTIEAAHQRCTQVLEEQRNRNNFYARARRPKWNIKE